MSQVLELANTVLGVAILGLLVKLYTEHIEVAIKVRILWTWWVTTYKHGKDPRE